MLYGSLATRLNPKIFLTCGWTCFHSALRTLTNIYVQSNRQSLELPVWDSQQSAVSWGSELTVNQEMQWDLSKNARGTWSRRVGCFILFPPPPFPCTGSAGCHTGHPTSSLLHAEQNYSLSLWLVSKLCSPCAPLLTSLPSLSSLGREGGGGSIKGKMYTYTQDKWACFWWFTWRQACCEINHWAYSPSVLGCMAL